MDQKKKSKLDRARDWWEMLQIKRRRHQSFWYIGWLLFSCLTYATMIGFGVFVQSNDDLSSTKVGQSFVIGETNYRLLDKKMDVSKRQAMVVFANPTASVSDLSVQIKASTEYLDSSGEKSSLRLFTGDKGYYVLVISNLPEKWKAMKITLEEMGTTDKTSATIILSERKETDTSFTEPTEKTVMLDSLTYQIQQKQTEISKKEKAIQSNETLIKENDKKIKKVKEEMAYQTESEQKESEGTIQQLNDSSAGLTETNRSVEQEIKELNEQISNIQEKIKDTK